jgi:hypothetical protein
VVGDQKVAGGLHPGRGDRLLDGGEDVGRCPAGFGRKAGEAFEDIGQFDQRLGLRR